MMKRKHHVQMQAQVSQISRIREATVNLRFACCHARILAVAAPAASNLTMAKLPRLHLGMLHFQFRTSGRSSPYLSMYCLCSISLSLSCCFR